MFGNLFNQKKQSDQGEPYQPMPVGGIQSVNTPRDPHISQQNSEVGQVPVGKVNTQGSKINPSLRQNLSALSHLDQRSTQVLQHSQEEAKRIKQQLIEPDQLLIGLLYDADVFKILEEFSVDPAKLTKEVQSKEVVGVFTGQPTLSDKSKQVFEQAYRDAKSRDSAFITPEDILLALFNDTLTTSAQLKQQGVNKEEVENKLSKNHGFSYGKKSVLVSFRARSLTKLIYFSGVSPVAPSIRHSAYINRTSAYRINRTFTSESKESSVTPQSLHHFLQKLRPL